MYKIQLILDGCTLDWFSPLNLFVSEAEARDCAASLGAETVVVPSTTSESALGPVGADPRWAVGKEPGAPSWWDEAEGVAAQ